MNAHPTNEELRELLGEQEPPCISLYQPTHTAFPQKQQNPVRFRQLLDEAQRTLRENYPRQDYDAVLGHLQALLDDEWFWMNVSAGLAAFASPQQKRLFRLPCSVPERVVVSDSFHLKPLIRILQADERYQVLALTLAEAKLYEGTRHSIEELPLTGIPATLTEALGTELTEPYTKFTHSHGRGIQGPAMTHGHGDRKAERNIDRDRFFRVIDRAITERFSNRSRLPLLLAALPEHQTHFREISRNPWLVDAPVAIDPQALSADELRAAAWEQVQPFFEQRVEQLRERYGQARAHQRGSDALDEVAQALVQGRIDTLLVEADRHVAGKLDPMGRVLRVDGQGANDDLLDDIAENVLRMGGEVLVLPAPRMPSNTGLAAIYRY